MSGNVQCARFPRGIVTLALLRMARLAFLSTLCCAAAWAQQPQVSVGNVEGADVSVSTSAGANIAAQNGSSAAVPNGGIIAVHSGQARLMLTSGGEIDMCGPAKFTLLESGKAITVALDFGGIRVQLPLSANLRIFTPTIIATPIDINGTPRDVTVGLELDDSLCVKAASGALLLENQFSSEKLVVPQSGEFFLAQGKLVPVARADSKCECVMNDARLIPTQAPSWSSIDVTPPAQTAVPSPTPAEPPAKVATAPKTPGVQPEAEAVKPNIEFSTLAHANEAHPSGPAPRPKPDAAPATESPTYKIVMPPLTFSVSSPAPPPDTTADMVLLIRSVEVEPEWEFKGHVNAPAVDAQAENAERPHSRQPKAAGAKSGFWAKLKHFFSGSNT
jgi:hypothetical protein